MKCTDMYRDVACVHKAAALLERPRLYEDARIAAWRRVREVVLGRGGRSPMVKSGMALYAMPDSREAGIERVTRRLQEEGLLLREGDMLVPTESGRAWRDGYDLWRSGGSKYPPGREPEPRPARPRPVSARRDYGARLDRGVAAARAGMEARLSSVPAMARDGRPVLPRTESRPSRARRGAV